LVGDAAGFVDALLGEGIYNAIRSGQEAASAIMDDLTGGTPACAGYAQKLRIIQSDIADCYRAAVKFYANLDSGYALLTSPPVRRAAMQGYAMGLTFSTTRKWFFLLAMLPVAEVKQSPVSTT
jgi:flavin-dependent dehydrogenase